jgi:uncharacterized protein YndB with AHSA1/START domain
MQLTDITVTRTIPAPPEKVFDVWLDPKSRGSVWFGAERVILNAAVDGLFYFSVQYEGRPWAHYGRFLALDRPHRIEHTWMSEATKGLDSVVAVTFEAKDGGTEVTLRHSGVPDDALGRQHQDGWNAVLGALADVLGTSKSGQAV